MHFMLFHLICIFSLFKGGFPLRHYFARNKIGLFSIVVFRSKLKKGEIFSTFFAENWAKPIKLLECKILREIMSQWKSALTYWAFEYFFYFLCLLRIFTHEKQRFLWNLFTACHNYFMITCSSDVVLMNLLLVSGMQTRYHWPHKN